MRTLGCFVSFDDASPPHKTVFSGKISDMNRYRFMAEYNWGIAFPPSIFELDIPAPAQNPVPRVVTTSTSNPSVTGSTLSGGSSAGPQRSVQSMSQSTPCKLKVFLSTFDLSTHHINRSQAQIEASKADQTESQQVSPNPLSCHANHDPLLGRGYG